MTRIKAARDLDVYKAAFERAMEIFELSKCFPPDERYSLTDQIRRSSRSVCANLAEAWRKRRYPNHFLSKRSDAESEAEETRVWLQFASRCGYLERTKAIALDREYDLLLGQLVHMMNHLDDWTIHSDRNRSPSPPPPVSPSSRTK
jgi:four helix bundle protein